jgi:hypothetical protein
LDNGGYADYVTAHTEPANGTALRAITSGRYYDFDGGCLGVGSASAGAVAVPDADLQALPHCGATPKSTVGAVSVKVMRHGHAAKDRHVCLTKSRSTKMSRQRTAAIDCTTTSSSGRAHIKAVKPGHWRLLLVLSSKHLVVSRKRYDVVAGQTTRVTWKA